MDAFETVAERFGKIIKIMRREMEELDEELNAPVEDAPESSEGEPL